MTHQKKQIENKALFIKETQSAVGPNLKKQTKMPKNLTEEIQNYEKTLRSITKEEIQDFRNINNLGILFCPLRKLFI